MPLLPVRGRRILVRKPQCLQSPFLLLLALISAGRLLLARRPGPPEGLVGVGRPVGPSLRWAGACVIPEGMSRPLRPVKRLLPGPTAGLRREVAVSSLAGDGAGHPNGHGAV